MELNHTQIAQVCHETNAAFCRSIGDDSQKSWDSAEQWQRDSAIRGVAFALSNPDAPASAQHDAWLADKEKDGWVWGNVKDGLLKTHPCMVAYNRLPFDQRVKDHLFKKVVSAFVEASAG